MSTVKVKLRKDRWEMGVVNEALNHRDAALRSGDPARIEDARRTLAMARRIKREAREVRRLKAIRVAGGPR